MSYGQSGGGYGGGGGGGYSRDSRDYNSSQRGSGGYGGGGGGGYGKFIFNLVPKKTCGGSLLGVDTGALNRPVAGLRLIDLPPRRCSLPSFFGGRGGSNGVPLFSFSTKSLR